MPPPASKLRQSAVETQPARPTSWHLPNNHIDSPRELICYVATSTWRLDVT